MTRVVSNTCKLSTDIRSEVARQLGREHDLEAVHISKIRAGDTVFHEDKVRTVSGTDIAYDSFMGHRIFGDSYMIGYKPVARIVMGRRPD